jgi:hypothetical protein
MRDVSNRTVLMLLFATIAISLGGTFITLNAVNDRLGTLGLAPVTGFAVVPNGTATVTISTTSSIIFTAATVAFGSGSVNTSAGNNCSLITLDQGTASGDNEGCDGFNELSNGFTVENDGNTNLTVELRSNKTAANFIGVGSALFTWNVTLNESGACVNSSSAGAGGRSSVYPNTSSTDCGGDTTDCGSIFEAVSTSDKVICPSLLFEDANDALNIDINITIPVDAPVGAKEVGLVVTGTAQTSG